MDGEVIDGDITIAIVPMAHVVDGVLEGVAWHYYDRDTNVLRFRNYAPSWPPNWDPSRPP